MKLRLSAAIVAAVAGAMFAGAAAAEPVVAKLQAGKGAAKPLAGGAVFECLGDVCAARAPATDTPTLRGCKDLARQMGPVISYGPASKPLSDEQIATCNGSAKK